MKTNRVSLLCTIFLGFVGALLWSRVWAFGFENGSGLLKKDFKTAGLLAAVSAAALVFALVTALSRPQKEPTERVSARLSADAQWKKILWAASAFSFFLSGITEIYALRFSMKLSGVVMGALLLFSGVSLLKLASERQKEGGGIQAFYALVPMYWGCYAFMMTFKSQAGNPVIEQFVYRMLAVMFVMLGFYRVAACLNGRTGSRMLVFSAISAIYFSMTVCIGHLLSRAFHGSPWPEDLWQLPALIGSILIFSVILLASGEKEKQQAY